MAKTIFEKSVKGRTALQLPKNDVDVKFEDCIPARFRRENAPEIPEVSELDVMRHFTELSQMNHFIEKGMYPLGSCTMKYNPKLNETLVRNHKVANLHPYQPEETVQGTLEILYELQKDLSEISGMSNVTLQPVAGAHGEFTGLKIIAAYHKAKGNTNKKKILFPDSAHGTNPASVILAGFEPVEIKSNDKGMVDIETLRAAANDDCAGFMLTNPNTLGIFENQIEEIAAIMHEVGGLMYMDGANLNALLGLVQPGKIGFDIIHFNLHKTFATPHGGGGPGAGPVGVREDLVQFLPVPMINKKDDKFYLDFGNEEKTIGKIHAFYGNVGVSLKAYIYIRSLGAKGLLRASQNAIINANYIFRKIADYYDIPFKEHCMHEFVASGEWQKKKFGIKTLDIAKRLLDKGYHAPTIYFPLIVHEAMMIEPTETESKETLDEFIASMIEIAKECEETPELVKNSPLNTPVARIDEVKAAKELNVNFK